ncbi:MAG TPA: NfeD family protein [Sphingomicrobium sp.]|nr:NfeD family protein [Sphingomicrobium sp.]
MMGIDIDPAWLWLIGGVILLIAEVIAPGFFLIFIGGAAMVTGILALLLGFGLVPQLAIFALVAYLAVHFAGRRFYASRYDYSADPLLNDPTGRLLGKIVVVVQPVDSHGGRVKLGDSEWSARGGPAAVGDRVRIVDIDGNCLKVEAEHRLPPA